MLILYIQIKTKPHVYFVAWAYTILTQEALQFPVPAEIFSLFNTTSSWINTTLAESGLLFDNTMVTHARVLKLRMGNPELCFKLIPTTVTNTMVAEARLPYGCQDISKLQVSIFIFTINWYIETDETQCVKLPLLTQALNIPPGTPVKATPTCVFSWFGVYMATGNMQHIEIVTKWSHFCTTNK